MTPPKALTVEAESYESDLQLINQHTFSMKRRHRYNEMSKDIDIFGNFWSFAFADFQENEIWVRFGRKDHRLVGPCAMFLPPFSVVEWKQAAGLRQWSCLISDAILPDWAPLKPTLYLNPDASTQTENESDVFRFLQKNPEGIVCEKNETGNPIALKLKKRIQSEFYMKKPISVYAKELGVAHEVMTRYFKTCYGVPPHEFRNKMRLMQIMTDLVLKPHSVTQTLHQHGFEDPSHFNEQFKKVMRTVPSSFKGSTDKELSLPESPVG